MLLSDSYIQDIMSCKKSVKNFRDISPEELMQDENSFNISPYQMSIGITPRCNSKCNYCVNWQDRISNIPTIEQIIDIIIAAKKLGVSQILLSGGEPLMHPQWKELIKRIKNLNLNVLLITNGLLLDEEAISFLCEMEIQKIGISLDTINPKHYRNIRGISIDKLINNLNFISGKFSNDFCKKISLCCTVHRQNIYDLDNLLNYSLLNGFCLQFQPIQLDSTAPSQARKIFWPTIGQHASIIKFFSKIECYKRRSSFITNSLEYIKYIPQYFIYGTFHPQKCYAPFAQITVDQSLHLRPCWAMSSVGQITSGSDLHKLWTCNAMNNIRNEVLMSSCPGCYYSCHLSKKYNKI